MILKKLAIKNIRSYEDQEIIFPKGSTLLSGDIGSGKTTILLAIEFALFGLQPSQKANALLRTDKDEATVCLELEIEDKPIIIERTLKKNKKSITQDSATIIIDNQRFEESITEIKSKVLKVLNYPQEFSKKTNLLYKFTVYTPQEEMKQIILESEDTRLNTLRHVFGIDKYKRIEENTSLLTAKLREKTRINEALLTNLEKEKELCNQKKENMKKLQEKKVVEEKEYNEKVEARKTRENNLKKIEDKVNEKRSLQTEKAKTDILHAEKESQLKSMQKNVAALQDEVRESKKISFNEEEYNAVNQRIKFQEEKEKELQKEYIETISIIHASESRKKEAGNLKNKIISLEKCPTCLQGVSHEYKKNIVDNADNEVTTTEKTIQQLLSKKAEQVKKIEEVKKVIEEFRSKKSSMEILKIKKENIQDKEKRVADMEKQLKTIEQDVKMLKKHIETIENAIKEFERYDVLFKERETELKKAKEEENYAAIKKAETNREIQYLEQDINERIQQIAEKEKLKQQTEKIRELEYWISEKFLEIILFTEKQVMNALKEEFSKLFSKWFSILVSESLSAKLDEDFSPIIEQQDYEIDYEYLSGGERTAIALAYRLSLNQVINSMLSNIKTANLIILDEPTDGFSYQQLDKMRDVLGQLSVEQLIIVSHEPKIESFVDNIIRIKKEKGISSVEKIS
ncbi:MAG: hypothetical protein RL557_980 [archaeon]|jgi:exonuclease SbcC